MNRTFQALAMPIVALLVLCSCGPSSREAAQYTLPARGAPTAALPTSPSPHTDRADRTGDAASIGPCPLLPANNIWNTPVEALPVDPRSDDYVDSIGRDTGLHPDFGAGLWNGGPIGIPYTTVLSVQPLVTVTFDYWEESDPGPYPIPPDAPIEGGPGSDGDRHVLVVEVDNCVLYEMWYAWPQPDSSWHAGSGAVFGLNSNDLRPDGWTSADAAGLPILPGLVRYDEVASGEIRHALRFTAPRTRRAYVWPARHFASPYTDPTLPPMGQRFRLRADFDTSPYSPEVQVILVALKRYGMLLADNGSAWYISGVPDERWDNDTLVGELATIQGDDFEAVDVSGCMIDADSAAANCFQVSHWTWLPLVFQRYGR